MKRILIIIALIMFAGVGYSQNVFNETSSGTIAMDGTWIAKYIGKGYKTIIVVNKSAYTLSVAFQKNGKRDTTNAITWIKSGSTPIFSSQTCDSMFFKATGDSVQYTIMYGQGIGFNYVGDVNVSATVWATLPPQLYDTLSMVLDSVTAQNKRLLDTGTTHSNYWILNQKVVSDSATAQNKRALDSLTTQSNLYLSQLQSLVAKSDSIIIRATHPLSVTAIHYVDTVSYKDTLTVDATSVTYEFGSQYSNVKLIGMSDTAIAGGDTLRAYNIGYRGDTTDIYFLDSANNRILYVVSSGDCKYKEYRLDILCPEYVMFKFNDSPIYTTKWYLIPKAYKK
jgi:hypothetical protein